MRTDEELEQELERLGELVRPPASVVEQVMLQIRADGGHAGRPISLRGRLLRAYRAMRPVHKLLSAAASIAIVAAVVSGLHSGGGSGIVWADVVRNIQEARTMVGWSTDSLSRYRFYLRDPGQWRTERYDGAAATRPAAEESPSGLEIGTNTGSERRWVAWLPGSKRVIRNRLVGRSPVPLAEAAAYWTNLKKIGSDHARKVGEERIGGVKTVVFEAPIEMAVAGLEDQNPGSGTTRVWVSTDTKWPVRVENRYRSSPGGKMNQMVTDLEWNVPLADDLFQVPAFDAGWTVYDVLHVFFANHTLKQGVQVSWGPAGGPAIATQGDVETIESGRELTQNPPATPISRSVVIRWTKSAADRIVEYAKAHTTETLVLNFGGRIKSESRGDWTVPDTARMMLVDIAPLGISLQQFERDYLTAGK